MEMHDVELKSYKPSEHYAPINLQGTRAVYDSGTNNFSISFNIGGISYQMRGVIKNKDNHVLILSDTKRFIDNILSSDAFDLLDNWCTQLVAHGHGQTSVLVHPA